MRTSGIPPPAEHPPTASHHRPADLTASENIRPKTAVQEETGRLVSTQVPLVQTTAATRLTAVFLMEPVTTEASSEVQTEGQHVLYKRWIDLFKVAKSD